jgi:hypothetical protein
LACRACPHQAFVCAHLKHARFSGLLFPLSPLCPGVGH